MSESMQLNIYYTKEDKGLIEKIEAEAKTQRRSKGTLVLSILEEHFQRRKKVGEILRDITDLSDKQLNKVLEIQKKEKRKRLLGEILLDEGFIEEKALYKTLLLQKGQKKD